jgi:hypothetical protein
VGAEAVTRIFDAAVWMYTLKLTCACGNSIVFHPHALTEARARFYCRVCWQKHCRKMQPLRIEPCREGPTVHLPMPDDREWKRAVNHNRG